MTICTQQVSLLHPDKRRVIETGFDGGDIAADGGVLPLQKADRYLKSCDCVVLFLGPAVELAALARADGNDASAARR